MTEAAAPQEVPECQKIALYFDLFPGTKADLESVAHASLAFARALKAAYQEIEPFDDIRVELVSGTEGSLTLNAILKSAQAAGFTKQNARTVTLAATGWFLAQSGQWLYSKAADAVMAMLSEPAASTTPIVQGLSSDEIERLAHEIVRIQRSSEVQRNVGKMYRSLGDDASVRGVGVRLDDLEVPPSVIVPRAEFAVRATDAREVQAVEGHRERRWTETVKLVTAVLDLKSRRKWVIETAEGVMSAAMRDRAFAGRLEGGQITTRLSANMRLDVDLMISESNTGGKWRSTGLVIEKVNRIVLKDSAEVLTSARGR